MGKRKLAALSGAIIAAVSIASCVPDPNSELNSVAKQVRTQALGLVAAYNAQDAHAAAAYDAPDYVGVFHGQVNTVGPAADEASMKAQMESTHVDWTIGEGKITVAKAGDIGIFEAPYTFAIATPNGGTTRERGTWIAIFKRQGDGTMKLWRSIGSDTAPPAPAGPAGPATPASEGSE